MEMRYWWAGLPTSLLVSGLRAPLCLSQWRVCAVEPISKTTQATRSFGWKQRTRGPESLTFSNLVVTSVLAVGKRGDDSALPECYTDVVFGPGASSRSFSPGWDPGNGKLQLIGLRRLQQLGAGNSCCRFLLCMPRFWDCAGSHSPTPIPLARAGRFW